MDQAIRTSGRAARQIDAALARELLPEDLLALGAEKGSKAPALKRLTDRHHALARTLAAGRSPGEAALMCGYDGSRVSILQADPAFRELLEFYRRDVDATYRGLHESLHGLALDAAAELAERLEDDDARSAMKVPQLMEIVKLGADRTGHGPSSSSTQVNVNVNLAGRLEAARRRVAERRALTIEGETDAGR